MSLDPAPLLSALSEIVAAGGRRAAQFRGVADVIRAAGPFRWVGLYRVEWDEKMVRNIVWSGPMAPAFSSFELTKGLTGSAISLKKTVNVGSVLRDSRYLTALGSTESEIIVPVFNAIGDSVVGTIDIESDKSNAFDSDTQDMLERCAKVIQPLWQ